MTPLIGNLVWPSLVLARRMLSPWIILASLAVEASALACGLRVSKRKAVALALVTNAASASAGLIGIPGTSWSGLLPSAGFLWEIVAGPINRSHGWGTFNPLSWAVALAATLSLNILIEGAVLCVLLRRWMGWRGLVALFLGNLASLALTLATILALPGPGFGDR